MLPGSKEWTIYESRIDTANSKKNCKSQNMPLYSQAPNDENQKPRQVTPASFTLPSTKGKTKIENNGYPGYPQMKSEAQKHHCSVNRPMCRLPPRQKEPASIAEQADRC
jgi:hypothetical protein